MSPPNDLPDYYELLGVTPDADEATIREAHKELGKTAHPDLGGNAALYRLITKARDTLVDPEQRAAYDRSSDPSVESHVAAGASAGMAAGAAGAGGSGPGVTGRVSRGSGGLPKGAALPLGGVVVIGLGVAAFFVFGAKSPTRPAASTTSTTTSTTASTTASIAASSGAKETTFNDAADGFSITYPKVWQQVSTSLAPFQADVPGTQDAIRVQVIQLGTGVDTSNLKEIKALTDTIVSASGKIEFESPLTVNKMIGYYYQNLYSSGSQEGSNSLYFLFQGRKMSILTFQSLPATDFSKLDSTFAQIVDSYKSNASILGPVPAPATTTPTTVKAPTKPTTTPTTAKG